MYGLNAVAFLFFIGINLLAYGLLQCPAPKRKRVMRAVCLTLLLGNVVRYGVAYPFFEGGIRIPVEFSTVAYFAVPTILLAAKRRMRCWAAYSGLMAGFFYCMALMVAGGPVYSAYPPYDTYLSMFCHGALYFCGLITISTERCSPSDAPWLVLGVAYIALRALLLRPMVGDTGQIFIYILLDGLCVKRLLPPDGWSAALPVYYAAVVALVLLTIKIFFKISQIQRLKFSVQPGQEAALAASSASPYAPAFPVMPAPAPPCPGRPETGRCTDRSNSPAQR